MRILGRYRQHCPAARTITVTGPLTGANRERLVSKMHRMAARGHEPITVDVTELSYFDSVSLTILLGTERIIERQLGTPVEIRGIDVATSRLVGLG